MNCWNTLRAESNHNVTGNGERDGLKMLRIGQSAAKALCRLKPTDVRSNLFDACDVLGGQGSSSTGHHGMALNAGFGLSTLAAKKRQDGFEQGVSVGVIPDDFVSGFARRQDSNLDAPLSGLSNELNRFFFAHGDLNDHSVLGAMRCSFGREFSDSDATLAVNHTSDISSDFYVHSVSNVQRLSRKGVRASARKDATEHSTKNGSDEIVFSAWKHAAASFPKSSGARLSESRAKNKAYIGDDYYALAWPTTLRTFKNNLETIHQYSDTGFKLIMNGEIGRYENVRYIEQTNIAKGLGTDGVTVTPFVNGKSDWIFIFGNDTVAEAIAVPEEMRGKIPTDYGRSKGVAWYYLGGFGIVHTLAQNVRIVKWDSAA